jgi:hypothetical protein
MTTAFDSLYEPNSDRFRRSWQAWESTICRESLCLKSLRALATRS